MIRFMFRYIIWVVSYGASLHLGSSDAALLVRHIAWYHMSVPTEVHLAHCGGGALGGSETATDGGRLGGGGAPS